MEYKKEKKKGNSICLTGFQDIQGKDNRSWSETKVWSEVEYKT